MEPKDLERIRNQLQRDLGMEIGEVVQLVQRGPHDERFAAFPRVRTFPEGATFPTIASGFFA